MTEATAVESNPAAGTGAPDADEQITSVGNLIEALRLTPVGAGRFRAGHVPMNLTHLFGGQVLAQALVAAARTVSPEKSAHSLHAYFLRAGDTRLPIEYVVETVRDGRRLSCRSVTAIQDGRPIATVITSFAATSGDIDHQPSPPERPEPYAVPTLADAAQSWGGLGPLWGGFEAIELRVEPRRGQRDADGRAWASQSSDLIWQRVALPLDDQLTHGTDVEGSPVLQQALLVYMSDIMLLAAALVPHGVPIGQEEGAGSNWSGVSLDHAIWFHQPVRSDEWLLFVQHSPFAGAGRSLSTAEIFDRSGNLVASVAQEGLILTLDP
ncbi:acyl-CoA thioesterase-2 [Frankineae bacterium MT45]|nr:acyl-CoA thioesterase-2 [Frankineae bacterium MT45]